MRSTHEVRSYLRRRGVPPALTARLIAECQARGVLDDRLSAALWAEAWSRRGFAWAAIRVKLNARGFDERTIQTIGKTMARASQEEARARLVVQRVRGRPGPHTRVRLARQLSARGFDSDVIEQLLGDPLTFPLSD
ncbi:MAG: RecX family transcriptional regulator [Candidatus Omnitrophica bacterium]|nr:RecX family transcriptional regulator [Candidatus Omnitrophota bacterium]